MDTTQWASVT
jgi:hypothetical protein